MELRGPTPRLPLEVNPLWGEGFEIKVEELWPGRVESQKLSVNAPHSPMCSVS